MQVSQAIKHRHGVVTSKLQYPLKENKVKVAVDENDMLPEPMSIILEGLAWLKISPVLEKGKGFATGSEQSMFFFVEMLEKGGKKGQVFGAEELVRLMNEVCELGNLSDAKAKKLLEKMNLGLKFPKSTTAQK